MSNSTAPEPGVSDPPGDEEEFTTNIAVHVAPRLGLGRYIFWYAVIGLAFGAIFTSAASILLPNQVQMLQFGQIFTGADANVDLQQLTTLRADVAAGTVVASADQTRLLGLLGQFESARATGLAIVTTIGTLVTMFIQPIVGVASDRTRSRLGRRAPWILYGGLLGAVLLIALRYAPSMAILIVLWTLAQFALNASLNPANATLADRVPKSHRGAASSGNAVGGFIGSLGAGLAAGALFSIIGLDFYFVLALLVALATTCFVIFNRDKSAKNLERAPFHWGKFFVGLTIAIRDRDFRWVWIARVLMFFGYGVTSALGLYLLQSYVQPALSAEQATATAPLLGLAGLPTTLLGLALGGKLSDKFGRRKVFVIIASFLMAGSFLIPLLVPTVPALFVQAVVGGLAFGLYLPVDQALFVDVLPDPESAGRDLGVAGMATNLGQSLAPLLAAQIVVIFGGYQLVYAAAAVLVLIAGLAIFRVRGAS